MLFVSGCFFGILANSPDRANEHEHAESYIRNYLKIAIDEMERIGMPASIIIAQGMLESSYGQSDLAQSSNNHFGIKCGKEWSGQSYFHRTREYRNGQAHMERHCFRSYESVSQSYKDHSNHLRSRNNYSNLFKAEKIDYRFWAEGLAKSGYATDPNYSNKLIKLVEKYDLAQYDVYTNKYLLPTEKKVQQFRVDPTLKMDREIMGIHVRLDHLEGSLSEARRTQAQILELQATIKNELQKLNKEQNYLKNDLNNKIQVLDQSLMNQAAYIVEMEENLQHVEAVQKSMLKSDPLADYFNEDGTVKQQIVIFPTRHHNYDGIFYQSGRRATAITEGQSFDAIRRNYDLDLKDLRRYNDLQIGEEDVLPAGCYVYLEPKANMVTGEKGPHLVQEGESMHLISQRYGIKLNKLYHRNKMKRGEEPAAGEFIFLNQSTKKKPQLRGVEQHISGVDHFGSGGSK